MKKEMTLKEFIEYTFKKNPFHSLKTAMDLIELESIESRLNVVKTLRNRLESIKSGQS